MSMGDRIRTDLQGEAWLEAASLQRVFDALETRGAARVAGGAVRDGLLGRPVADVDVATTLAPDAVIEVLRQSGIKTIPTGLDHGTVTAVAGDAQSDIYQVTTLRVDVETDGRHAKVAFTDDWAADAGRRDFTMNALYCDRVGALFDPLGGYEDLAAGLVRFAGEARQRIEEDYLRILRFFRFNAVFGDGRIDAAGLRACEDLRTGLDTLSRERIHQELIKLLAAPGAPATVKVMAENGILAHVLPARANVSRFAALCDIEDAVRPAPDALLRLAALALRRGDRVDRLRDGLKLTNAQTGRLAPLAAERPDMTPGLPVTVRRQMLYRMGASAFEDAVLFDWSASGATADDAGWAELLALMRSWTPPEFPLRGSDLLARGIAAGPLIGTILDRVEDWWVAEGFPDSETSLRAHLESVIADCDKGL
jgi:poly(A) polymerase